MQSFGLESRVLQPQEDSTICFRHFLCACFQHPCGVDRRIQRAQAHAVFRFLHAKLARLHFQHSAICAHQIGVHGLRALNRIRHRQRGRHAIVLARHDAQQLQQAGKRSLQRKIIIVDFGVLCAIVLRSDG